MGSDNEEYRKSCKRTADDIDTICDLMMVKTNFAQEVRRSKRVLGLEALRIENRLKELTDITKELAELKKEEEVLKSKKEIMRKIPKNALKNAHQTTIEIIKEMETDENGTPANVDQSAKVVTLKENEKLNLLYYLCYEHLNKNVNTNDETVSYTYAEYGDVTFFLKDVDNVIKSAKYISDDDLKYSDDISNIEKNLDHVVDLFTSYINMIVGANKNLKKDNAALIGIKKNLYKRLSEIGTKAKDEKIKFLEFLEQKLISQSKSIDDLTKQFLKTEIYSSSGGSLKECNRILQKYQ